MRIGQQQPGESRTKIERVFEKEEEVCQNFKISNFYSNHRLNLVELKSRLEQFKHQHQPVTPPPLRTSDPSYSLSAKVAAFSTAEAPVQKQKITLPTAHRPRLTAYDEGGDKFKQALHKTISPEFERMNTKKMQQIEQVNYRIVKEARRYDHHHQTRTASGQRSQLQQPRSMHSQHERVERGRRNNLNNSKCSDSSNKNSCVSQSNCSLEGKLVIGNKSQLIELQKQITVLWGHYQLLTKILLGLRQGTKRERNAIVKYVEDVCSDRFQFIREWLAALTREGAQRAELIFVKRLKRSVVLSRLLESMAVVYVGLSLCTHRQPEAHLVNFVGYCCSNVTFLIRLGYLLHSMESGLTMSSPVAHILGVIGQFQEESYKQRLTRAQDVVLRMEHNNEIIGIVQSRLCSSLQKDFQKTIVTFLKNVDPDSKTFYEYSHYIYEFLAYQLAKKNIVQQFSFLQMAPSPYLPQLQRSKTLVIEPWEVLLCLKGTTTYIRSYCDTFLKEMGRYWNIVYWTDLMPEQIDTLLPSLPPGKVLYRYHCRHENERYLKLLWRLGTETDNTIIIDRQDANFKYDKQMGISLPWLGKRKDSKLLDLLAQLHNFLLDPTPLRKIFPLIRQALMEKKEVKVHKLSEPKEEVESLLPRAMVKNKRVSRFSQYQTS